MKKILSILLITLISALPNQLKAQNCPISANLINYYTDDIKVLATEYMWQTQQDTTSVQIPQVHFDYVAKKMSAIFELQNNVVRDSIFDRYCVHDVLDVHQSKQIVVFIDPNESWTQAWMNLNSVSGNITIDNFLSNNNLTVETYTELPYQSTYGSHYVVLSSPTPFNQRAAINWLNEQAGINYSYINNAFGGAGRITFYEDINSSHISFTQEWSDCGDGCDNMITWYFEVDNNCNVNYVGRNEFHVWSTWPDSPETNCNITLDNPEFSTSTMDIYPNPFRDYIEISGLNTNSNYIIYNSNGQKIKEGNLQLGYNKINTESLPKGVYLIKIKNDVFKIIK